MIGISESLSNFVCTSSPEGARLLSSTFFLAQRSYFHRKVCREVLLNWETKLIGRTSAYDFTVQAIIILGCACLTGACGSASWCGRADFDWRNIFVSCPSRFGLVFTTFFLRRCRKMLLVSDVRSPHCFIKFASQRATSHQPVLRQNVNEISPSGHVHQLVV